MLFDYYLVQYTCGSVAVGGELVEAARVRFQWCVNQVGVGDLALKFKKKGLKALYCFYRATDQLYLNEKFLRRWFT